ncbi:MAG: YqgE/AlgH family protein, partial [Deltaproteobacteria bacterium]|nr:YqgE/AlgH family protein [Deltaproteobacteria bacterium]
MKDQAGQTSLKGQLLVAMPQLLDPHFHLTVTYLCVHNADGAFGLVVNREIARARADAVFKELSIDAEPAARDLPLYYGGPVHP